MDRQAIFNKVATALLAQDAVSFNYSNRRCLYTDSNDRHCAIGHLLAERPDLLEIAEEREGTGISELLELDDSIAEFFNCDYGAGDSSFLSALQGAHDSCRREPDQPDLGSFRVMFTSNMRSIAKMYDLTIPESLNG